MSDLDPYPWECRKDGDRYVGNNPNPSVEFNKFRPRIGFEQDRSKYPANPLWEGWDE